MSKDNDIKSKKNKFPIGVIIFFGSFFLYFYLIFFVFFDKLSFKIGICDTCSGLMRLINNPLPSIIFVTLFLGTAYILQKKRI